MKTLYPYQLVGAQYLVDTDKAILGDPMGLGKTVQVVEAVKRDPSIQRVLVICPASLTINWRREFDDHHPTFAGQLTIVSYDKARTGAEALSSQIWDVVVADEAHYLKNRDAKRTIAAFFIARRSHRLWLLTGTPMPNNPSELWTLLRATRPDLILSPKTNKPMSFYQFRDKFCHIVNNGFGDEIRGGRNLDELSRIMAQAMLRRSKEEVLDLPALAVGRTYIEAKISKELRALEAEFGPEIYAAIRRLEAGDETAMKELAPHVAQLRRVIGMTKAPAVAALVTDLIEASDGDNPIIVFAHHTEVVATIAEALRAKGVSVCTVTGASSITQRQEAVDGFQSGKYDVFVGNIIAAGVGITLTRSCYEIFAEEDWTPSNNEQAMMRAHRIGQTRSVTVQFATLANSIDEAIQAAVARKAADITAVITNAERAQ